MELETLTLNEMTQAYWVFVLEFWIFRFLCWNKCL